MQASANLEEVCAPVQVKHDVQTTSAERAVHRTRAPAETCLPAVRTQAPCRNSRRACAPPFCRQTAGRHLTRRTGRPSHAPEEACLPSGRTAGARSGRTAGTRSVRHGQRAVCAQADRANTDPAETDMRHSAPEKSASRTTSLCRKVNSFLSCFSFFYDVNLHSCRAFLCSLRATHA